MSDNLIMLCVVLAIVAVIAVLFIRRAIGHRKAIGIDVPDEEITIEVQPKERTVQDNYLIRYILTYTGAFKSSKTVRIRPEYVDRIKKAGRIVRGGKTTVTAYVDKVLQAHFEQHGGTIDTLYHEKSDE